MAKPQIPDGHRSDVAIVGGGAAGLAAALQLARARRSVVVVDSGEPRNAPAAHMHSYLGHEGRSPLEFLALGRQEVQGYGVEVLDGRVTDIAHHDGGGFQARLADGHTVVARRVLVATGLTDVLPDVPGVAEQWGRGVIHCPYCHGWEVRDRPLVVIATSPAGAHQAALFRQLSGRVTVVVHDGPAMDAQVQAQLSARGVRLVQGPVAEVVCDADDQVTGVRLNDGTVLAADAVVVAPRFVARAEPVASLGITPVAGPMGVGEVIATDPSGATTVPGVYAAGNAADALHQVLQAAAEGSRIAAAMNADLVAEDTAAAVATASADAGSWDDRYAGADQMWSGRANDVLIVEVDGHQPGRALDVGCGEGADALWLAARGWQVTAVDVSQVALDRAAVAARAADVEVDWVRADIVTAPTADGYDLVSVQYPALKRTSDDAAICALLAAVAPGGTLLVAGHAPLDPEYSKAHGFDPADYVQPADIAAHLDGGWELQVAQTRPRRTPPPHGAPFTHDTVLRARRRPCTS